MRYIDILEDIQITDDEGEAVESLKFSVWFEKVVLRDQTWGLTDDALLMAGDLRDRVRVAVDMFEVSEAEWAAIKKVVAKPTNGYNVKVAIQTIPFIKAVRDAKDKKLDVVQRATQ